MDEAHMLGKGRYLNEHGYVPSGEIIKKHLHKICEIAKPYGYDLLVWSDMFMRVWNGGAYYLNEVKKIPDEVIGSMPKNVFPVYWDYFHEKEEEYDCMLKMHNQFESETWFAGGICGWTGFAPHNRLSIRKTREAIKACQNTSVSSLRIVPSSS